MVEAADGMGEALHKPSETSDANRPRRREIRALTGLRGVAALWVMVGHYRASQAPISGLLQRVIDHKGLAVDLFLMLSGFVLAMAYGRSEGHGRPWVGMRVFLWHRLARIYPLYFITTLACLVLISAGRLKFGNPSLSPLAVLANLLMVQSWWDSPGSINGPGWSISTEWAANLLFPILALGVLAGARWIAMLVATCALLVLPVIAYSIGGIFQGQTVIGCIQVLPEISEMALVRNLAEFVIGMVCWRVSLLRTTIAIATSNLTIILVSTALLALLTQPALDVVSVALFAPLLLGLSQDNNIVARALGSRVPRWFGLISFSIYLVHVPALSMCNLFKEWMVANHVQHAQILSLAVRGLLPIFMSVATYALIERPCQKWLAPRQLSYPKLPSVSKPFPQGLQR